ncbi:MAG: nitroreductase family protein [Bacteroidales bacterium]|jgi:nitroreductase|nr:nitroreductase family protein [Bacteroidales bacterium]
MMNPTLNTILTHKSIRIFTDQPVSQDVLNEILQAACNGSTMGNMQLYSIIITEDKAKMEEMAPFHFNQPIATNAPLILTFCADFNRFNHFCSFRDSEIDAYNNMQSYHWAFTDAIIAAQNACVAAESLGLGLCWLGTITFNADKFIEVLKLPVGVVPVACIALGYPAENPPLTDKLPIEALIHREYYHDYTEEEINRLYHEKEIHPNSLQLYSENELPNLAQIFTRKRYTKKDNEYFTTVLMEVLKKQGFL